MRFRPSALLTLALSLTITAPALASDHQVAQRGVLGMQTPARRDPGRKLRVRNALWRLRAPLRGMRNNTDFYRASLIESHAILQLAQARLAFEASDDATLDTRFRAMWSESAGLTTEAERDDDRATSALGDAERAFVADHSPANADALRAAFRTQISARLRRTALRAHRDRLNDVHQRLDGEPLRAAEALSSEPAYNKEVRRAETLLRDLERMVVAPGERGKRDVSSLMDIDDGTVGVRLGRWVRNVAWRLGRRGRFKALDEARAAKASERLKVLGAEREALLKASGENDVDELIDRAAERFAAKRMAAWELVEARAARDTALADVAAGRSENTPEVSQAVARYDAAQRAFKIEKRAAAHFASRLAERRVGAFDSGSSKLAELDQEIHNVRFGPSDDRAVAAASYTNAMWYARLGIRPSDRPRLTSKDLTTVPANELPDFLTRHGEFDRATVHAHLVPRPNLGARPGSRPGTFAPRIEQLPSNFGYDGSPDRLSRFAPRYDGHALAHAREPGTEHVYSIELSEPVLSVVLPLERTVVVRRNQHLTSTTRDWHQTGHQRTPAHWVIGALVTSGQSTTDVAVHEDEVTEVVPAGFARVRFSSPQTSITVAVDHAGHVRIE